VEPAKIKNVVWKNRVFPVKKRFFGKNFAKMLKNIKKGLFFRKIPPLNFFSDRLRGGNPQPTPIYSSNSLQSHLLYFPMQRYFSSLWAYKEPFQKTRSIWSTKENVESSKRMVTRYWKKCISYRNLSANLIVIIQPELSICHNG